MVTQKLYANFLVKEIKNPSAFSISFVQSHLLYQSYIPDTWISACSTQHSLQTNHAQDLPDLDSIIISTDLWLYETCLKASTQQH